MALLVAINGFGRIGRLVMRKLLLRGYNVRALVRGMEPGDLEGHVPSLVFALNC